MIGFLTRHEWKLLTTSAVVRIVVSTFAAALALAAILGIARVSASAGTDARQAVAAQPASAMIRAEVVANERGSLHVLPPAPMAALAAGQSDVYPSYVKVTARNVDAIVTGDQVMHPLAVAAGHFDAAFVILYLYPLLIFAVSFDLTAGERDRGTLRMVLAQPVRLPDVIAGKMIARLLLLGVPAVLIPMLAAIGAPLPLIAAWTLGVIAYGSVWHGLALLINARGWNAPTNALVLAGVWLMLAVVGPATINLLIELRYPMPSRVEAAVQARAATQEATVQGSRELGQFLQDHPTSANVGREGMRQFARLQATRDREVADRLAAVDATFDRQLRRQQHLASWLSVLSPTMAAQQVLLEAAGTGTSRFERFEAAARQFQLEWKSYFEPRVLDAATLTAEEIAGAPRFDFENEPAATAAWRAAPSIAAMFIAGVILLCAGFWSYRGYAL